MSPPSSVSTSPPLEPRQPREPRLALGTVASGARPELLWYADIEPTLSSDYLVRGLLSQAALAMLYGEPGVGKSFLALDLGLCVAAGIPWHGHNVRQGVVIYLCAEAGPAMLRRVEGWRRHHKIINADFAISTEPLDLLNKTRFAEILDVCVRAEFERGAIHLIVIDTVSRSMPGGDENASEAMTQLVAHCDVLRSKTGAAILLVHHRGKDAARGARGHSSLRAAVDTEIEVSKGVARITKQRDEPSGWTFAFQLEPLEIGPDDENQPVRTCVVTHKANAVGRAKQLRLTARQRAVLASVTRCIEENGVEVVDGSNGSRRSVSIDAVLEVSQTVIGIEDRNRSRAAMRRVIDALAIKNLLAISGKQVSLP